MFSQADCENGGGHERDVGGVGGQESEHETKYPQVALTLVNNMLKDEIQEDYELVLVEKGHDCS